MQKKKEMISSNLLSGYKIPKKELNLQKNGKPYWRDYIFKPHKITKYWWDKQKRYHEETSKFPLQYSDIIAITVFSLISAFIVLWTKVMIWMRWSTFPDNSYFFSWHPITPWIAIFGSILYLIALYMKRVNFWLAYFPACVSIIYCLVELSMINSWLSPHDLAAFFEALGLNNLPDWLTGGRV
jgi:hypothetical protein